MAVGFALTMPLSFLSAGILPHLTRAFPAVKKDNTIVAICDLKPTGEKVKSINQP